MAAEMRNENRSWTEDYDSNLEPEENGGFVLVNVALVAAAGITPWIIPSMHAGLKWRWRLKSVN